MGPNGSFPKGGWVRWYWRIMDSGHVRGESDEGDEESEEGEGDLGEGRGGR
jgi:hypothetical protein